MVNFYDNYLRKCNAKGVSPSRAAIEAGTTKTSVNRWKFGSMPSDATLLKLADYFECPVSELIGFENAEPAPEDGSGRYGLTKADWWGIGNGFKHELNVMARPPEYLANVSGIPAERVSAFLSGEAEISKAEIEALAKAVGKPLEQIIHGYAMAFEVSDDEESAQRDIINRVYDALSSADRKTLADFAQNLALSRGLHSEGGK